MDTKKKQAPGFTILYKSVNDLLSMKPEITTNALQITIDEFKKNYEEQKAYNEELLQEYVKNHHIPRREKEVLYDTYVTDKGYLKNVWNETKDISKLFDYLQFKIPEPVLTEKDYIYTMYTSQYKYNSSTSSNMISNMISNTPSNIQPQFTSS
jgi:hypothetical protein